MKKPLTLLTFLLLSFLGLCQLSEGYKYDVFKNFTLEQRQWIDSNWTDYYFQPVDNTIITDNNFVAIYLDSYGVPYQPQDLSPLKREQIEKTKISYKQQAHFSMYHFNQLKTACAGKKNCKKKDLPRISDDAFAFNKIEAYNNSMKTTSLNRIKKEIDSVMYANNFTKVLFFSHGYNVPYSLAVVQLKAYMNEIKKIDPTGYSRTLFIPVFWPSNNQKECKIGLTNKQDSLLFLNDIKGKDSTAYHDRMRNSFSIKNKQYPFFGGFRNKKRFTLYTKHAYMGGITMRQLLNTLDSTLKTSFMSHSTGAIMASTVGINVVSPLQFMEFKWLRIWKNKQNNKSLLHYVGCPYTGMICHRKEKRESVRNYIDSVFRSPGIVAQQLDPNLLKQFENDYFLTHYLSDLATTRVPEQHIKYFMSAPAITGVSTFKNLLDSGALAPAHYKYYITTNIQDPILGKRMIKVLNLSGIAKPNKFGATTLGFNYEKEADKVEVLFDQHKQEDEFVAYSVQLNDHDAFLYLDQPEYKRLFQHFILDKDTTRFLLPEFKQELKLLERFTYRSDFNVRTKAFLFVKKNSSKVNVHYTDMYMYGVPLKNLLYKSESQFTPHNRVVSDTSFAMLQMMNNPYTLELLEKALLDDTGSVDITITNKLLDVVNKRITNICRNSFPYYSYESQSPQKILFIKVQTGNDLFRPELISKKQKTSNSMQNYDMEYTGSLNVQVATDYLRTLRRRPILSYQSAEFGFDVWTPYFKDPLFVADTSQDSTQRPHGSFIYFGWNKYGLSKYHGFRWNWNLRFGSIGSDIGKQFQNGLHQDISQSPYPYGWGAQIANGKRLGFSARYSFDQNLRIAQSKYVHSFANLYFQPGAEVMAGTYMTKGTIRFAFSNKSFREVNHDAIANRDRLSVKTYFDNLYIRVGYDLTRVVHNSMLEGYGLFTNNEKKFENTPIDKYVLQDYQIRRTLQTFRLNMSYTTRYFTFFYEYAITSPETKLRGSKTLITDYGSYEIDFSKRWHKYGTIGLSFNLHTFGKL